MLTFDNETAGKTKTIRVPAPLSDIATRLEGLETHMTTYVAPVLINSVTFSDAKVEDKTVTVLLEDLN